MTPSRVKVIRLFDEDQIDNKIFDCNKISLDSNEWISCDRNDPDSSGVFFVKNHDNSRIFKAIYLHSMPYPVPSNWFHTINEEFIEKNEITHWMPMSKLKT